MRLNGRIWILWRKRIVCLLAREEILPVGDFVVVRSALRQDAYAPVACCQQAITKIGKFETFEVSIACLFYRFPKHAWWLARAPASLCLAHQARYLTQAYACGCRWKEINAVQNTARLNFRRRCGQISAQMRRWA